MTQDKQEDPLDQGFQRIFGRFERVDDKQEDIGLIELKQIVDDIIPECGDIDCRTCQERHMRLAKRLHRYTEQREAEALKQGQRVGAYRVAERLYGDVTSIYLFKDDESLKLKENADGHARELLKDCEQYMNDNRKAYTAYLEAQRQSLEDKSQ